MHKQQLQNKAAYRFKRFTRKSYAVFSSIQKVITIGVLSGSALLSAHAQSQTPVEVVVEQSTQDSISQQELDEVVVTSSRLTLPIALIAHQVTVISQQDIERAPAQSIEDLLAHYAGVDIQQRGPHGVQADISLRGGTFDQTAILLNGINLTNPQTGHYSFDLPINLSDIDRIEIVQGPTSLAYGAGAFSGGVNIITKKERRNNLQARLEGGMHGLLAAEAGGSIATPSTLHQLSAGYRRSDGYMPNSDYNMANWLLQNRFDVEQAHLDLTMGFIDKNYGANTFYSAAYPNQYDKTRTLFTAVKAETRGRLKFIPSLYWHRHYDEFQLIREGTPQVPDWYKDHNYHRTDVMGANLVMQYASQWGLTAFGSEFRNESIVSSVLGLPMQQPIRKYTHQDSRSDMSYFLEHTFIVDRFTFLLGGMLHHNTALPNQYNLYPALDFSYRANNKLSLFASWNKATRMPTFTDLYYTTDTHMGNSDLKAEQSESIEVGVKYNHRAISAHMAAFMIQGTDIIDWVKDDVDALWRSANHTTINKKGLEMGATLRFDQLLGTRQPLREVNLGYMYLHQGIAQTDVISNYSLNHLRHKLTASLHHDVINRLSFSWHFRWQDRAGSYLQYIDLKPTQRVNYQPYPLLDFKAGYRLGRYTLFVNINNLLNTTYYDLGNLPQPGFWMMGGVRVGILPFS